MSETIAGKALDKKALDKSNFTLGISGFSYSDLYKPERLRELAETFYDEIKRENADLYDALMQYIAARGANYEQKVESKILTDAAPYLSNFIARLFKIEPERESLLQSVKEQDSVWQFKFFAQRRAIKKFPAEAAVSLDLNALNQSLYDLEKTVFPEIFEPADDELTISKITVQLLEIEESLTKKQELTEAQQGVLEKLKSFEKSEILQQLQSDLTAEADGDLLEVKTYLRLIEAWTAIHSFVPKAK